MAVACKNSAPHLLASKGGKKLHDEKPRIGGGPGDSGGTVDWGGRLVKKAWGGSLESLREEAQLSLRTPVFPMLMIKSQRQKEENEKERKFRKHLTKILGDLT